MRISWKVRLLYCVYIHIDPLVAAHLNPFYLREHSKRILRGALYNDSKFLADINVMDYSLVCGVCVVSSMVASDVELSLI
jgi:hypothetical protein